MLSISYFSSVFCLYFSFVISMYFSFVFSSVLVSSGEYFPCEETHQIYLVFIYIHNISIKQALYIYIY